MRVTLIGSLTLGVVVTTLVGLASLAVPQVYESNAVVEVRQSPDATHPPPQQKGGTVEGKLAGFAQDAKLLGEIAAREGGEPSKATIDRLRASVQVRARTPTTFEIAYRSRSADLSQQGCRAIAESVVDRVTTEPNVVRTDGAREALDRATKQLTDFFVAHPDALPEPNAQAGSAPTRRVVPGGTDPAVALLRQEKARIESEIANAEDGKQGSHQNPYEDPSDAAEVAKLKLRLGEIHNAIVAHQHAMAAVHEATSSAPASSAKATDLEEWRKLMRGVAEAERAAFSPSQDSQLIARILEPAGRPDAPLEPLRRLIALSGAFVGLVLGCGWAGFRTWRRRRRGLGVTSSRPPGTASTPAPAPEESRIAYNEPTPERRSSSPAREFSPLPARPPGSSVPPISEANVRIPPAPAVPNFGPGRTQIGMIDPAAFAAQTAPTAPRARVESRPIVGVTAERGASAAQAGVGGADAQKAARRSDPPRPRQSSNPPLWSQGHADPKPNAVSAVRTQIGPARAPTPHGIGAAMGRGKEEQAPVTQRVGSPSDPVDGENDGRAPNDALAVRRSSSYSFVDHDATARRRASSRPVAPPAAGPDGSHGGTRERVVERNVSLPEPPAAPAVEKPSSAPPRPRSTEQPRATSGSAPVAQAPAPTQPGWQQPSPQAGLALHSSSSRAISSRPPDPLALELINPRSAPPSWRAGPLFTEDGAESELNALRDQLLELCQQRCFVVGVTSEPEFGAGKSQTAARLATLLAADGRARVLLLEADFEYPVVQRLLDIDMPHGAGFSQQMRARIKSGEQRPWVVVTCSPTLHILGEGVMRTPGLLFSQEFSQAVGELRRCYDVIVADGPVVGIGADHKPLDAAADGLVFVVRAGAPLSDALDRAVKHFKRKEFVAVVSADVPANG